MTDIAKSPIEPIETPSRISWKRVRIFKDLKDHPEKPTGTWGKPPKTSRKTIVCYWGATIIYVGASLLGVLDVLFVAIVFGIIAYELFGYRLNEQKFIGIASISGAVLLFVIAFFSVSAWTGYETKPGYTLGRLAEKQHYDLGRTIHPIVHNGVIRLQRR